MNFKKIMAAVVSASIICLGSLSTAYAEEETTENEIAAANKAAEAVTSEDGQWEYKVQTDEESGDEYLLLEKYLGRDAEVSIPSELDGYNVERLGQYTFYENPIITKITVPETIEYFGDFSFFACTELKEFEVAEENDIYDTVDGVLFGDDKMQIICYPPAKTETEYTIPDGVVALYPAAFATCTNLKTVNFPDTLEKMGLYCFAECTSLNNVVIPENVSELSDFNFTGCTSLTDISLPENMHTIGGGAFFSCTALDSIEFPKYIKEIGQGAFVSTAFEEIELPSTIQEIGYSAFGYTTDQQGQLVAMDSFIIKGLENSVAHSFCVEEGNEHITFQSVGDIDDEDATTESNSEKSDGKSDAGIGFVVAIIAAAVVAVSVVVIIVVKKIKGKNDSEDNEEEYDNLDEDNDENDDEE